MPLMTVEDIKNKAPDRASFTAAKKLASAAKWSRLGQKSKVLWGVATGSKGDSYYVYVDVGTNELECSCPSRKRPCKHALGLLILDADGHQIPEADPPTNHKWNAKDRYTSSWE